MSRLLADLIFRWRYLLTAISIAGALAFAPSANITTIDNDITAWYSTDDPVYQDYERFRREFGGTRTLIVALQADSADRLFSSETLAFIEAITSEIERVDTVQRVDSLATATVVHGVPDGLEVQRLIEARHAGGPDEVRRRALADDLIRGDLVSEDGTVTALVVSFDEDRIDAVRAGVIGQIHEVVDPGLPQGVRAYYNGSLEISETYNRITLDNQRKFIPPILLVTVAAIFAMFRSIRKTLLTLVAVGLSVLWTLGLYSLMGFSYNVLSSMILPLIVVLAIADDVHIMQHWDEERRHGNPEQAFKNTVAHLMAPLLGASATTALGMLSLATSDVMAVRSFGIGSAVGIMVDFAISIAVMPTLLSMVQPETSPTPHERYLLPPLQRVALLSTRQPRRVLVLCLAVGLVAALGVLRLRVDTNHINFFSPRHPLGESATVIDEKLSGVYSYQIMLEGPPDSLKTPDALRRMDRLQEELRGMPYVRKVTSVADYVKRIHRELNDDRSDLEVIPPDAETVAQELFVFTLGSEGGRELGRIVSSDYSRAQISVKLQSMGSDQVLEQIETADRRAGEIFEGTGISALTTGSGRLFSTLDHYLVRSQLTSFGTAFVTVFAVIFVVFRSFRFGLLTIVPNVLPVIAVLGVMGYLDISMNVATVMVASVALGVVDDDTIHFINRYRREVAAGASTDDAIGLATAHEGRASLTTAIINSCGYAVLMLSEYKPTAWFGGLLALTMVVAFLAEVLLLPATIKLLPRVFGAEALRGGRAGRIAAGAMLVLAAGGTASAQGLSRPTGHAAVMADALPDRDGTLELRARLFAEETLDLSSRVRVTASGFVEGLLGRRPEGPQAPPGGGRRTVRDAIVRAQDAHIRFDGARFELLAGFARVPWGRLDEIQPTDVVNPLDVSRFFFEGRGEARLPVAVVSGRLFLSETASLEAIYVPIFRRGRLDQLHEPSAPFSPASAVGEGEAVCLAIGCPPLGPQFIEHEPPVRFGNAQGGARVNMTVRRVDWSVSAYRGFEPFPLYTVSFPDATVPDATVPVAFGTHPRFTMIGADFETVRGAWGIRGELGAFVDDSFQSDSFTIANGASVDAGLGLDRRAGNYRVSGTVLVHRETYENVGGPAAARSRSDVSLVLSADRSLARERYRLRAFGVANTNQGSGFTRVIATAELQDNVLLEGSAGWFIGDGEDLVGRFADSDFAYIRLKYHF